MELDQRDPQTYAIIGAAMEVHNTLGHGFLEAVYHEALVFELIRLNIPFRRECALPVIYKVRNWRVTIRRTWYVMSLP